MANGKKIAKTILIGIGKVFYYFGQGLWIFCKLLGRGIQTAYYNYEARRRVEAQKRQYYAEIERENYHAGRGIARGIADFREQERLRRQDERNQREYFKRVNSMYEVPRVKDPFEAPKAKGDYFTQDFQQNRKKKKRSFWDY